MPTPSKSKPRARKPGAKPASRPAAKPSAAPTGARIAPVKPVSLTRVKWSGFRVMMDFWGQPMKRYYQLETLANATEASLQWKNSFVYRSVHEVLGAGDISSLQFELFQEGRYQLIFKLRAGSTKGKSCLRKKVRSACVVRAGKSQKRPGHTTLFSSQRMHVD